MNDKKLKWTVIRFVGALVITVLLVVVITVREGEFSTELRNGLVKGCETNGNSLRSAVQHTYEKELQQLQNPELYRKIFSNLSEAELNKLMNRAIIEAKKKIKDVEPIDCEAQYPNK